MAERGGVSFPFPAQLFLPRPPPSPTFQGCVSFVPGLDTVRYNQRNGKRHRKEKRCFGRAAQQKRCQVRGLFPIASNAARSGGTSALPGWVKAIWPSLGSGEVTADFTVLSRPGVEQLSVTPHLKWHVVCWGWDPHSFCNKMGVFLWSISLG